MYGGHADRMIEEFIKAGCRFTLGVVMMLKVRIRSPRANLRFRQAGPAHELAVLSAIGAVPNSAAAERPRGTPASRRPLRPGAFDGREADLDVLGPTGDPAPAHHLESAAGRPAVEIGDRHWIAGCSASAVPAECRKSWGPDLECRLSGFSCRACPSREFASLVYLGLR